MLYLYLDGTSIGTPLAMINAVDSNDEPTILGAARSIGPAWFLDGFMTEPRYSNIARYQGIGFIPPTGPYTEE